MMSGPGIGQEVVVIDRHHLHAYEEGTVMEPIAGDGASARVRLGDGDHGWDVIEHAALAPLPQLGERRRWNSGSAVLFPLGPFTLTARGTTEERLFTVRYDDPVYRDGIASAAELARYSELYTEPDGAEDGTTGETRVVVMSPRGYGKGAAALDTLRDVVLETALEWEEAGGLGLASSIEPPKRRALRDAIKAYRTARDS